METTEDDQKQTVVELKCSEETKADVSDKTDPPSAEDKNAEFEYLQRNEFTSEIYKIEVRNLGYFGIGVS